jgi:GTPase
MSETPPNRCGQVAILGRPNVGKSTLLNRLVGQKLAITADKPQTTRHRILGVRTEPGVQAIFVDTPGIHRRGDQPLNRYLNRAARASLPDVDLVLFVVEAMRWTEEDADVLEAIQRADLPAILVVNKVDKVKEKAVLLPWLGEMGGRHPFREVIPLSARSGKYMSALESAVFAALPEGGNIFPEDQITDRSERFFASELIREQLTRRYGQEIPYALTVEIEQFVEEGNLYRIAAVIWVERPGQKAILIGKGGEALKEVATAARVEMEKMFDRKVFLTLWVKHKKSWSSDEQNLARLGYTD